jgi:uncharacterized membrane protein YgdD (TMEM256/DUF423 family)
MQHQHHSNVREGLLTGLLGALVVTAWYFAVDLGRGEALYTPNVLGQVFVQGDTVPAVHTISSRAVAQYELLHFAVFCLFGLGLAALTHLAVRNPAFRMAVWMGLVIGFVFFLGFFYMLHRLTDQAFPWWTSLGASLLGVGSMGVYLWRRHPALRSSLRELPLGAEVKPPPHPPGAPRA